jgi:hypothetical protein
MVSRYHYVSTNHCPTPSNITPHHHPLPLLNNLTTHHTILRIAQRPHNLALGFISHQPPQTVDEIGGEDVYAPVVGEHGEDVSNVEPARESLEELACAVYALREVFDAEEVL